MLLVALFSCSAEEEVSDVSTQIKTEVITTSNMPDNETLFTQFKADLESDRFVIEDSRTEENFVWYDGDRDVDLKVEGEGIRWYYIKQHDKPGETQHYHPDFNLMVFEFENRKKAKSCYQKIDDALRSNSGFMNGKGPQRVVFNQNEVFYFSSRAEMFRRYINFYAKQVEGYH